ncbi:MAG: DUF4249 domain-containing protein [Bacteroidales bacterium]|nr:DUF4249 domain-containing protein [Bacteroidales bacterium]
MKRFIYMLTAILAISSCEYEFEIEGQMSDSQTYIRFVPSNESDTTFFFIQATTPLKDANNPSRTEGESVKVLVNGTAINLEKQEDVGGEFSSKVYATTHKFNPGDKIELEASIPGRKTATASTSVPQEFPQPKWSYKIDRGNGGYVYDKGVCFDIEYDNALGNSGRYAVAVLEERSYQQDEWYGNNVTGEYGWTEHNPLVGVNDCSWYMPVDNTLSTLGQEPLIFRPARLNWDNRSWNHGDDWYTSPSFYDAMAWTDIPEKTGGKGTYQVYVRYNKDSVDESYPNPENWDPDVPTEGYGYRTTRSYRYKLVFYSFDEASYDYQKAQENNSGSVLAGIGLAPASMTYTNIRNGVGVCGAYTVSETDWFKITE